MFLTAPQVNSAVVTVAGVRGPIGDTTIPKGPAAGPQIDPVVAATHVATEFGRQTCCDSNGASDCVVRSSALGEAAVIELYEWLNKRRSRLFGDLRECDRQDAIEETFVQTLAFIPKLRNPDALRSACLTIGMRIRSRHISVYCHEYRGHRQVETVVSWNPEGHLYEGLRRKRAFASIDRLRPYEREILRRFYFYEQSAEQICAELQLTETQFRLKKSRAIKKAGLRAVPKETCKTPGLNCRRKIGRA